MHTKSESTALVMHKAFKNATNNNKHRDYGCNKQCKECCNSFHVVLCLNVTQFLPYFAYLKVTSNGCFWLPNY